MGGAAFALDGLSTPRMPPVVYKRVLQEVEARLKPHFATIKHCIEAPEKADYGDVDVLAVEKIDNELSVENIARILGAKSYFQEGSSYDGMRFAIPWPKDDSENDGLSSTGEWPPFIACESVRTSKKELTDSPVVGDKYVQVDLTVCRSYEELSWRLFAHGHGDFANILSRIIRRKGLTINNRALYLRIPDLDTSNKKLTRIILSENPDQALQYLGLEPTRFWDPFPTRDDMMNYLTTCRFYDPGLLKVVHEEDRTESMTKVEASRRDKSQLESRPLFQYWRSVYLPAHEGDEPGSSAQMTREEVRQDAFAAFGDDTRARYEKTKTDLSVKLAREKLWPSIRAQIVEKAPDLTNSEMHDTMRALRHDILQQPTTSPANPGIVHIQEAFLAGEMATVRDWAIMNHAAALVRWRAYVEQKRMAPKEIDEKKANKYSLNEVETYTEADDKTILSMKEQGRTWSEILMTIGKKSKSQLQGHWKNDLQNG